MFAALEDLLLQVTLLSLRLMLQLLIALAPLMIDLLRLLGWQLLTRPRLVVLMCIGVLWLVTDRGFGASVVALVGASALIGLDTLRAHMIR